MRIPVKFCSGIALAIAASLLAVVGVLTAADAEVSEPDPTPVVSPTNIPTGESTVAAPDGTADAIATACPEHTTQLSSQGERRLDTSKLAAAAAEMGRDELIGATVYEAAPDRVAVETAKGELVLIVGSGEIVQFLVADGVSEAALAAIHEAAIEVNDAC
jgi:hypothetical protein